jgi:hypothetical protein
MGRRILNRKDLRSDFDAAERRKGDEEETDEEEGDEEEADEEEAETDEEASGEEPEGEADEEDEEAPPKKAKKPKAAPKPKAKPRTRTPKVVRMKVVWGVFNNSNQRVAVYEYPKRKDADEHAARLTTDKKSTHFVQPVKEPIEEKKEKE